ncbi:MAG: hypothetical protein HY820_01520 [Acidobacteria bacterium]|nr:hypothetical protein [Acidobacteriota bacterium]
MIEYDVEDDELFAEDEESDDEYFVEDDEADDDSSERRRRRRVRRPPSIRVGRTGTGRNLVKRPVSKAPVTTASLQASLDRVGRDIRANAAAIKSLGSQVKSATERLTKENNRQDSAIADLRSDMKKQGGAASQQNQLNMLLPLLQKTPELEAKAGADPRVTAPILGSVQVKKVDNTLPLVIAMMGAMQPGSGGGAYGGMNMMLPMILLLDK